MDKDSFLSRLKSPIVLCMIISAVVFYLFAGFELPGRIKCKLGKYEQELDRKYIETHISGKQEVYDFDGKSNAKMEYNPETDEYVISIEHSRISGSNFAVRVAFCVNNYYGKAAAYIDGSELTEWNEFSACSIPHGANANRMEYSFYAAPCVGPNYVNEYRLVAGEDEYIIKVRFNLIFDENDEMLHNYYKYLSVFSRKGLHRKNKTGSVIAGEYT